MFKYLRRKLGLDRMEQRIEGIPVLNVRYMELLTPLESVLAKLKDAEGDDTLVMHHMRCMGYFDGWEAKRIYEEGRKHGKAQEQLNLSMKE